MAARRATIFAGLALGLAACAASAPAPSEVMVRRPSAPATCERSIGIFGLEAPLSIGELTRRAEVVVVGTVIADRLERLSSVPGVPAEERHSVIVTHGSYHDTTLQVTEYLKGIGPRYISVRRLASTPELCVQKDQAELVVGTAYVLFLERGRGVWSGGYIALSMRGTGVVTDGVAHFAAFGALPPALLRLRMSLP